MRDSVGDELSFEDCNYGSELRQLVDERIPAPFRPWLEGTALILLKPDALLGGVAEDIVHWLTARGVSIVFGRLLTARHPAAFEELYKFNISLYNAKNHVGSWWLNRQVYDLGPSAILLVHLEKDHTSGPTLHALLRAWKGPSDPCLAQAGTVRGDFRGSNLAMNLIHVSDSWLSTVREFLIFHDWELLRYVLADVASGGAGRLVWLPWSVVPSFEFGLESLVIRLRLRWLSSWWPRFFRSDPELAIAVLETLRDEEQVLLTMAPPFGAVAGSALAATNEAVARIIGDCRELSVFRKIGTITDLSLQDAEAFVNCLRADDIFMLEQEVVGLLTGARYRARYESPPVIEGVPQTVGGDAYRLI